MTSRETMAKLSGLIKSKRKAENIGLRKAHEDSGVSPSTLSRLERGISTSLPDFETLNRLAAWLNIPLSSILDKDKTAKKKELVMEPLEQIEVYLKTDKNLSPETADALFRSFRILYGQLATKERK